MATLYIRDVPAPVAEVIKERARLAGMSVSAYVSAELTRWAERPTAEELLAQIDSWDRSDGLSTQEIVDIVRSGRGE